MACLALPPARSMGMGGSHCDWRARLDHPQPTVRRAGRADGTARVDRSHRRAPPRRSASPSSRAIGAAMITIFDSGRAVQANRGKPVGVVVDEVDVRPVATILVALLSSPLA